MTVTVSKKYDTGWTAHFNLSESFACTCAVVATKGWWVGVKGLCRYMLHAVHQCNIIMLFCPMRQSPNGFFDSEASIP